MQIFFAMTLNKMIHRTQSRFLTDQNILKIFFMKSWVKGKGQLNISHIMLLEKWLCIFRFCMPDRHVTKIGSSQIDGEAFEFSSSISHVIRRRKRNNSEENEKAVPLCMAVNSSFYSISLYSTELSRNILKSSNELTKEIFFRVLLAELILC